MGPGIRPVPIAEGSRHLGRPPDTALQHIAAEQVKPVVVDERNIFVARQAGSCLLVRGKSQADPGSKASFGTADILC